MVQVPNHLWLMLVEDWRFISLEGIAQDALIMNIDDLLCVGAVENILVSSTIGRNKSLVDGSVISSIINGTEELLEELRNLVSLFTQLVGKQQT